MKTFYSFQHPDQKDNLYFKGKKNQRLISWFFLMAMLHLNFSCSYFKVKEVPLPTNDEISQKLEDLKQQTRYIVIHSGPNYYHLADAKINADQNVINGMIENVGENHKYKKQPLVGKSYKYKPDKQDPLNELHIYLKEGNDLEPYQNVTIDISKISSIALVDKNTGRTVANIVIGVIGATALLLALAAALKGSCPFIYTYDGQDYIFNGELYPGNIIKNAQRPDYLKLNNLATIDGFYKVKVSNELLEVEHTDQMLLWAIDHPKTSEVLLDPNGGVVNFGELAAPESVYEDGFEIDPLIVSTLDNNYVAFNSNHANPTNTREVVLKFKKPIDAENASLKLSAKNSLWLDMLFGKMNEKFGSYYNTFQKNQQDLKLQEVEKWIKEQSIALNVSILENGEWRKITSVPSAGPLAFRDYGLSLDLKNIVGDEVEIKLETGFMFWEVDYAAMSFAVNTSSKIQKILPFKAITQDGEDVSSLLLQADGQYHIQDKIGQAVEVSFKAPNLEAGYKRTFFIQSKGYYNYIRDYSGIPNFTELMQFRKPGYFPRFSETQFKENIVPFILAEHETSLAQ